MVYNAYGGGSLHIKKENFEKVVDAYHNWTAKWGCNSSNMQDIKAVFDDQWFEVGFDEDGNLEDAYFPYEKYGGTSEFLEILAPWVEDQSFLDFTGEDGALWRISFKDHKYYETSGVVQYPGDPYSDTETAKPSADSGEMWQIYDALCRALTNYENCDGTLADLYVDVVSITNSLAAKVN